MRKLLAATGALALTASPAWAAPSPSSIQVDRAAIAAGQQGVACISLTSGQCVPFGLMGPGGVFSHTGGVDATTLTYLNATAPLKNWLSGGWNVTAFGAVCDNTDAAGTNNTAKINALVTSLATVASAKGGLIYVPGVCALNGAITVPASAKIWFEGAGMGASGFRQTNPTADGIDFNNGTDFLTFGQGVSDMTVEAGAGLASGGLFGQGSTGTGIKFVHTNDSSGIRNVAINNFANPAAYLGTSNTVNSNFTIHFFSGDGIVIDKSPDGYGGAGNQFLSGVISNFGFTGTNTGSIGIHELDSGGNFFSKIDITYVNKDLVWAPQVGEQINYDFIDDVLGDSAVSDGCTFDGSAGNIYSVRAVTLWCSYDGGNGLVTKGPNLHGLRLINPVMRENHLSGWSHQGGDGIELDMAEVNQNGQAASTPTYAGIFVATGAGGFNIRGGTIGNNESGLPSVQCDGIGFAAGASANISVQGVNLRNQGTGCQPINSASVTLSDYVFSGNLPRQTPGVSISEARPFSTGGYLAANATAYFNSSTPQTTYDIAPWFSNGPGVVSKVHAESVSAPGAGQTYTYTLIKNGAPTTMTGSISGAASYSVDILGAMTVGLNDRFEVQVVSSAGAAGGIQRLYVQVEP